MSQFRSGKVTTGISNTLSASIPETQDVIASRAPRKQAMGTCYKALNMPCNLVTPNGTAIHFMRGYFVTSNPALIEYLNTKVGTLCELC